jgi:hypothetical protein
MKQIAIIFILFLASELASAQRPYGAFQPMNLTAPPVSERDYIDTVKPLSFIPINEGGLGCFTGVYSAPDSGYVAGNNKYGDREKAQFFSLSKMGFQQPATIQNVAVYVGIKTMNSLPEDIFVRIYESDTSSFQPGNLLATSNPLNLSAISTGGIASLFSFISPVSVVDSFFISVVLPQANGDTIALVSTLDDCSAVTGWSWELWSNGTWHTLLNSWILDIDLAVFPIMDLPFNVGIQESLNNAAVTLYPNPASEMANLAFNLPAQANTTVTVINQTGAEMMFYEMGLLDKGVHNFSMELSGLPNGTYTLSIRSDRFTVNKPLVICK